MVRITLPKHLKPSTKSWIRQIMADYELESQHVKILIQAGECWDRICQAREEIEREGPYFIDRFGAPKSHPAVADERNGRVVFARLLRELNLSEGVEDPRPPRVK